MSAVVHMIMHDADPAALTTGANLERKVPSIELKLTPNSKEEDLVVTRLQAAAPPRTFFTHLGYDALPKSIVENKAKVI